VEHNQEITIWRKSTLSVWLGALILCAPALVNKFPFLYADTGTYLQCGFQGIGSDIRPMTYGVFIRHASLNESLWLVIFIQCLILSWTIHMFYKYFSTHAPGIRPLIAIFILTLMTGVGEVAGMLMPDIFTPIMILSGAILLFGKYNFGWRFILLSLIFILAVACHHSNALIIIFTIISLMILRLIYYFRKRPFILLFRKYLLVSSMALVGYFAIPLIHWTYTGDFYWSRVQGIFLTNRINQMGLLKPFLDKNCPTHDYRLCPAKDSIPFDLLWSQDSPMNKSGGMRPNNDEYARMVGDFMKQPFFLKKFFIKTLENGVIQFFTIEGLIITKEHDWGYPYQVMQQILPEFIPPYRVSVQYADKWDHRPTQLFQRFLVFGSIFYLLYFFIFRNKKDELYQSKLNLGYYLLLALIANAFICAGISMVDVRFQYRVVWIIPLFAMFIFGEQFPMMVEFLKKKLAGNNSLEEK